MAQFASLTKEMNIILSQLRRRDGRKEISHSTIHLKTDKGKNGIDSYFAPGKKVI